MDDTTLPARFDELDGIGPALKLRRLRMGLVGKQVAFDAGLAQDWFEHREAGARRLTSDAAERWCGVLGTTVSEMVDEVIGVPEVLPKHLTLSLFAYVGLVGGRKQVLEISPAPPGGPNPEDAERAWANLDLSFELDEVDGRAVRPATRAEKVFWLENVREQLRTGELEHEHVPDWPAFPYECGRLPAGFAE